MLNGKCSGFLALDSFQVIPLRVFFPAFLSIVLECSWGQAIEVMIIYFFSSAQVICKALSDSNFTMIDFFSPSISLPCKGVVVSWVITFWGWRLIDCFLTLTMLNVKAACVTRLSGHSINCYRIWACPLSLAGHRWRQKCWWMAELLVKWPGASDLHVSIAVVLNKPARQSEKVLGLC